MVGGILLLGKFSVKPSRIPCRDGLDAGCRGHILLLEAYGQRLILEVTDILKFTSPINALFGS